MALSAINKVSAIILLFQKTCQGEKVLLCQPKFNNAATRRGRETCCRRLDPSNRTGPCCIKVCQPQPLTRKPLKVRSQILSTQGPDEISAETLFKNNYDIQGSLIFHQGDLMMQRRNVRRRKCRLRQGDFSSDLLQHQGFIHFGVKTLGPPLVGNIRDCIDQRIGGIDTKSIYHLINRKSRVANIGRPVIQAGTRTENNQQDRQGQSN